MHAFKKGDRVAVINQKLSGVFFVEGRATVVRRVRDLGESYVVRFENGDECQRFVDPAAQASPEEFCARLNAPREIGNG
jgi:hypothetical protein